MTTPITEMLMLGLFGLPGGGEWIVLLVLGLLIFGRRLPEVGRWLGSGIVEFKRGIKGIQDDVEEESGRSARQTSDQPQQLADDSQADPDSANPYRQPAEKAGVTGGAAPNNG
jgi:sec-independent protein translocase protein TatA